MKMITSQFCNKIIQTILIVIFGVCASTSITFAQERITVRSGDHPTYSRLVFDWQRNLNYSTELKDGNLEITFDANAVPDFTSVLVAGPTYLSNPTYDLSNGKLIVNFEAKTSGHVRDFRSGTKVVIDLMAEGGAISDGGGRDTNVVSAVVEPAAQPVVKVVAQPINNIEKSSQTRTPSGPNDLLITATETNNDFTINYNWNQKVKAAVFIRANRLWVVFDRFVVADHDEINSLLGGRVTSAEQLSDLKPTILNYGIAPNQGARMVQTANGWQLSLRSNLAVPQVPIEIGRQSANSSGENIFLMVKNPGDAINIVDPFIGDDIAIVTTGQSSQGVVEQNNYPEFNILKSAQGIALQLIADDIFVARSDSGVSVSSQNGLAVSRSSIALLPRSLSESEEGSEQTQANNGKFLDFENWKTGPLPGETYVKNRHELLYRLATADEDGRNEARWNLAVYNLANDNAAEAFGILQLMSESEPGFLENPSYRAVLAIANIKMRRFREAVTLLSHKSLVAELDALLWRSRAYEAMGEYQNAMDDFNLGLDVLGIQNNDDRAEFLFSAIRDANALGDIEFMSTQINGIRENELNAKQLTELDFWRGQLAEKSGDEVLAGQEYDKVIATGVRYPASLAQLARINQQYRLKEIEPAQAIDALEKLRFAWRGDDFEIDLLKRLGEMYVIQNEFREGLSTLRQAATYFPRSQKTSGLTRTMSEIYGDLFLNGGADKMSPLKAMALFLEFRELTPLGADGDTMSRALAARMVAVDLLNDAADLLEYHVQYRLEGVARADIASDLARIYVMNKEPDKALKILRSTRQAQVPEDIEFERQMIEIRSLVELGQYEEAEVMLDGIHTDVAENLRSDIFWKSEDWKRVVSHGYEQLDQRWTDSQELDDGERQLVLRIAVALALDENLNGLEGLRTQYMNHMEGGLFADAFELITAKEQKTGDDIRELTQTIASVDRLETFMESYRSEFAVAQ